MLDLGRVPATITEDSDPLTDKSVPLCLNCAKDTVYVEQWLNTSFPSEHLEFWYMWGRGYIGNQPPIKSLDNESLTIFPLTIFALVDNVSYILSQFDAGEIKYILPMERGLLEAHAWFPWHLFPLLILLCILSLLINHSHVYNRMLRTVSPPSESANLVLGIPASISVWVNVCVCVVYVCVSYRKIANQIAKLKSHEKTFTTKLDNQVSSWELK